MPREKFRKQWICLVFAYGRNTVSRREKRHRQGFQQKVNGMGWGGAPWGGAPGQGETKRPHRACGQADRTARAGEMSKDSKQLCPR